MADLTSLERDIIMALDFDLQSETSLNFVERFCQLYHFDEGLFSGHRGSAASPDCVDMEHDFGFDAKKFSKDVCDMAKYLCRYCLRNTAFLDFLPSQIAAACFLLALNAHS